jgi:hypothetical protein
MYKIIEESTKDTVIGILIIAAGVCAGEWLFLISKTVALFIYGVVVGLIGVLL